jgi:hypothetical protein
MKEVNTLSYKILSKFKGILLVENKIYSLEAGLNEIINHKICIIAGRCPSFHTNILHLIHYKNIFDIQKKLHADIIFCHLTRKKSL